MLGSVDSPNHSSVAVGVAEGDVVIVDLRDPPNSSEVNQVFSERDSGRSIEHWLVPKTEAVSLALAPVLISVSIVSVEH